MANDVTPPTGSDVPRIGVGMLGYAFMGKAHSNAFKTLPYMMFPPVAIPELVAIAGRDEKAVRAAAARYGYKRATTDWRDLIADDEVQLLDNGGPNDAHAAPSIAAAEAGKHVLCEKPLARSAEEARTMLDAAQKAGVKHMVAFNYRFVPAIRQIRNLIDGGALGRIYHWRATYLQEWLTPRYEAAYSWRLNKATAGSGALGDLGAHIIDLAHYLVGGVSGLKAYTRTFVEERPLPGQPGRTGRVDVDDAFVAACEFESGALGTFEATRFATGRKNANLFEINAEKASVRFDLERLNEFEIYRAGDGAAETEGWTRVLVTQATHPWVANWWPPGHIIGWEHTFVHEIDHLLRAIVTGSEVGPHGATFEDGYRAAVVCDAILESAAGNRQVDVRY